MMILLQSFLNMRISISVPPYLVTESQAFSSAKSRAVNLWKCWNRKSRRKLQTRFRNWAAPTGSAFD